VPQVSDQPGADRAGDGADRGIESPSAPPSIRRRWVLAASMGALVLSGLVLTEGVVRLIDLGGPVHAPRRFEPTGGVPFERTSKGVLRYRPGDEFAAVYDLGAGVSAFRVRYHINEFGLRGPAISRQKSADIYRVICLGDSLTFGEGVEEEDAYPAVLQRLLSGSEAGGLHQRVEVINAGVQAHDTVEEAALFESLASQLKPDAVTLGFFMNDAMDFLETIRQNEAWTRAFEPSAIGRMSRLWGVAERVLAARRLEASYFDSIRRSFASPGWDRCRTALQAVDERCRRERIRLIVAVLPVLTRLDEGYPFTEQHRQVVEACAGLGIECVDLFEAFRGADAASLWVHPTDHHPNREAHERIARALAARLGGGR
jgi:lysophospholipase L1-like esterase